jgi:Ca2+/Na+ antiporter
MTWPITQHRRRWFETRIAIRRVPRVAAAVTVFAIGTAISELSSDIH